MVADVPDLPERRFQDPTNLLSENKTGGHMRQQLRNECCEICTHRAEENAGMLLGDEVNVNNHSCHVAKSCPSHRFFFCAADR